MNKHNRHINKFLTAGLLCASLGLMACDDYLTIMPTNQITEEDFWKSKTDLDGVRAGVYRQMGKSAVTGRIMYWGELRADNMQLYDMKQTHIQNLQQGILMPTQGMFDWASLYTGINYCNLVLEKGEEMTEPGNEVDPTFRRSDWRPIKSEMIAMRALNYFYLVRAYRDVPYVTTAVRTDEEARARKDGATAGVNILGTLIKDLEEEALPTAATNYGLRTDNQGRITKQGIQALLADIYIWRGCMLLHSDKKGRDGKGDVVLGEAGDTLTAAQCTTLSKECFNKAISYCDDIMTYMDSIYEVNNKYVSNSQPANVKYRYLARISKGITSGTDPIYSGLWGNAASSSYLSNDEIIFQLNYDGNKVTNDTPFTYTYNFDNAWTTGYMTGAGVLYSSAASSYNPERGYGKSDIRLLETLDYSVSSSSSPIIHKNILPSVYVPDYSDMTSTEGSTVKTLSSTRSQSWPIYRLTDVMLMKAEAIARSVESTTQALQQTAANASKDGYKVTEGFNLVNAIFERNNPKLNATGTDGAGDLVSDRLKPDYAYAEGAVKTADDLLTLTYNERQREFVAEGKRWFDIVRQCEAEYNGSNSDALSKYITLSTTVRNRLKSLYSLYNPIYSEEIKINGVDYGGNLQQNPIWERYTVK